MDRLSKQVFNESDLLKLLKGLYKIKVQNIKIDNYYEISFYDKEPSTLAEIYCCNNDGSSSNLDTHVKTLGINFPFTVSTEIEDKDLPKPLFPDNHKCICGNDNFEYKPVLFINGRINLQRICFKCGQENQYIEQEISLVEAKNSLMPFGKWAGYKLSEIPRDYLIWAKQNLDNKNIKRKIEILIKESTY